MSFPNILPENPGSGTAPHRYLWSAGGVHWASGWWTQLPSFWSSLTRASHISRYFWPSSYCLGLEGTRTWDNVDERTVAPEVLPRLPLVSLLSLSGKWTLIPQRSMGIVAIGHCSGDQFSVFIYQLFSIKMSKCIYYVLDTMLETNHLELGSLKEKRYTKNSYKGVER